MKTFEILKSLLEKDRSIRRFEEQKEIGEDELKEIVSLAAFCASARNAQPLKYRIVSEKEEREVLFPELSWAGYLTDWEGPSAGERPAAYIIQCLDTSLSSNCLCDDGLQLQAITLGAAAKNLGCCIIKSFNPVKITDLLELPQGMKPLYVVAIGHQAEKVVIDWLTSGDDSIKYYRSADGVHHVPKRKPGDLII